MNLNKVIVLGRVTADPELKKTPGGNSVASFSIATNRVWTDKSGAKQDETEFHRIVAWGRTAEVVSQYSQKGALLLVEGRLKTRTWEDKQGVKKYSTEIIAESIQLGPKPTGVKPAELPETQAVGAQNSDDEAGKVDEIDPADLPF